MPTFVITGCSSGIGLELVKQLSARGEKIYALVRKKESSMTGKDQLSEIQGDITIVEGIDVASDEVGEALAASALAGVTIDVLIHNAGSVNATREVANETIFAEQKLDVVSMDRMRACFELNTLGPLRVQQALNAQMASPGGKVAIVSTGLGSIGDNGSGGIYAYRTSKAAVNMIGKSMSADLKDKGISVSMVAPGFVVTEFGPGQEALEKMGGKPVGQAGVGIIQVIDDLNMENTGTFMMVPSSGEAPKEMPW